MPTALASFVFLLATCTHGGAQASEARSEGVAATESVCAGVTHEPPTWRERCGSQPAGEKVAVEPYERDEPLSFAPQPVVAPALTLAACAPEVVRTGRRVVEVWRTQAYVAAALARGPPR